MLHFEWVLWKTVQHVGRELEIAIPDVGSSLNVMPKPPNTIG
jgi:hypothetical protein